MQKNKSYIFFSILISILLLVTGIIWSSCKITVEDKEDIEKSEEKQVQELTEKVARDEEKEKVEQEEIKGEFEWFQTGNKQPIIQLQPKPSVELEDNRIGDMWCLRPLETEEHVNNMLYGILNVGYKRTRLSFDYYDWDEVISTGESSKHYIDPIHDNAITTLADNGIKIMYVLNFWDESMEITEDYSRFRTEDEIQHYLDYVQFIVHHFKDRIEYYEILNEPNAECVGQYVELADYINLIERVIPVI